MISRPIFILLLTSVFAFGSAGQEKLSPVIMLEREACRGMCPVYKLTIFPDGKVVFDGTENVKTKGVVSKRISRDAVQKLIEDFKRINYFDLKDEYAGSVCPQMFTDAPSAVTALTLDGKTKTVRHYYGCRGLKELDQLTELEEKIDEVVNTMEWIGNR